jgi:hypothetical protein
LYMGLATTLTLLESGSCSDSISRIIYIWD